MTSSRRDEGVDEHPQPKNNAEWSGRDIDCLPKVLAEKAELEKAESKA